MATVSGGGFIGSGPADAVTNALQLAQNKLKMKQDENARQYAATKANMDQIVQSQYSGNYALALRDPAIASQYAKLSAYENNGNALAAMAQTLQQRANMDMTVDQQKQLAYKMAVEQDIAAGKDRNRMGGGVVRESNPIIPQEQTPGLGKTIEVNPSLPQENNLFYNFSSPDQAKNVSNGINLVIGGMTADLAKSAQAGATTGQYKKGFTEQELRAYSDAAYKKAFPSPQAGDPTADQFYANVKSLAKQDANGYTISGSPTVSFQAEQTPDGKTVYKMVGINTTGSELRPTTPMAPYFQANYKDAFTNEQGVFDQAKALDFAKKSGIFDFTGKKGEENNLELYQAKQGLSPEQYKVKIALDEKGKYKDIIKTTPDVTPSSTTSPQIGTNATQTKVDQAVVSPAVDQLNQAQASGNPAAIAKATNNAKKAITASWHATKQGLSKSAYAGWKWGPSQIAKNMNTINKIDNNTDWRKSGFIQQQGMTTDQMQTAERLALAEAELDYKYKALTEGARQADQDYKNSQDYLAYNKALSENKAAAKVGLTNALGGLSDESKKLLDSLEKVAKNDYKVAYDKSKVTWDNYVKQANAAMAGSTLTGTKRDQKYTEILVKLTGGATSFEDFFSRDKSYQGSMKAWKDTLYTLMKDSGFDQATIDAAVGDYIVEVESGTSGNGTPQGGTQIPTNNPPPQGGTGNNITDKFFNQMSGQAAGNTLTPNANVGNPLLYK